MPRFKRTFQFSNFQPFQITYQGIVYRSVEHFYQAMKFRDEDHREMIAGCKTAGAAKKTSRSLSEFVREDWDQKKLAVMRIALEQKFAPGTVYHDKLMATTGEIIEDNNWCDQFFGDCVCEKCAGTPGENHLGKLLMEIRDGYRKETTLLPLP